MAGESMEGSFQVIKLLSRRPTQWNHCIALARLKFDKYFKRKVTVLQKLIVQWPNCFWHVKGFYIMLLNALYY